MLIKNIIMAQKKNVIGEKYNRLLIIGDAPSKREPSGRLIKRVEVKCDCGTEKVVDYKQLKRDKIKSCGCISKEIKRDINTGDTFGCLTILEELGGRTKTKKWERTFRVVCKCGDEKIRTLKELKTNIQKCRMCPSTAVEKIRKEN